MLTLATAAFLFSSAAHADEEMAETCLRTKIWDGYTSGWQVRSQTNTSLGSQPRCCAT